jgi:hypothetical protein
LAKKSEVCEVCGSSYRVRRWKLENPLCNKHYNQMVKHGKILNMTVFSRNEIIEHEDFDEVILRNKKQEEISRALISKDKAPLIKEFKWYLSSNGYVCTKSILKTKVTTLHRFIINAKEEEIVDHINRNKLDCRDENLRRCTKSQNAMNTCLSKRNTSGTKGVWFNKLEGKWVAEIFVNGKKISLGHYLNIEDAIKNRKKAEVNYFGEYAAEGVEPI